MIFKTNAWKKIVSAFAENVNFKSAHFSILYFCSYGLDVLIAIIASWYLISFFLQELHSRAKLSGELKEKNKAVM